MKIIQDKETIQDEEVIKDEKVIDEEMINEELINIYSKLQGMKEKYIKTVNDYHTALKDNTRTDEFKLKQYDFALELTRALRREYVDEALTSLDELEEAYKKEESKDDETTDVENLKNIILWDRILPTLGREEFKEYWIKYRRNQDFKDLAANILNNDKDMTKKFWLQTFEKEYTSFPLDDLFKRNRLKIRTLNAMGDTMMIPNEFGEIEHTRNVTKDLRTVSTVPFTLTFNSYKLV